MIKKERGNKKMIKKINKTSNLITIICLTLMILTITVIAKPEDTKETIATTSTLSNTKIGWGIKRKDNHEQPDLGSTNQQLIDQYNGMAMGNREDKSIYLTFDLGYEAGYTENILNVLKEKNVQGAFFITAHYLNTESDLVERMINEGHIVGNHTPIFLMPGNGIEVKW